MLLLRLAIQLWLALQLFAFSHLRDDLLSRMKWSEITIIKGSLSALSLNVKFCCTLTRLLSIDFRLQFLDLDHNIFSYMRNK